jgi:SAM-dependent methyltransferase
MRRLRSDKRARTATHWGQAAREKAETTEWQLQYWQSHPVTERHITRLISGDENEEWLRFTRRRFGKRRLGLSLGCGYGVVERRSIEVGLCPRWDAYDLSPEAVAVAEEEARRAGLEEQIRYHVADINTIALPTQRYDLVIVGQSLHHVEALEHVLDEVAASLTPGGIFVVQEYVGPARFQVRDEALEHMNRLLSVLPDRYLYEERTGQFRRKALRPKARDVARVDPSEAIRSDEIVPLVEERFEIVYRADFGGTLLHLGLGEIIANFDPDEPVDVALLDLMCLYEEALIANGVIESDFTYIVGRRRR